MSRRQTKVVRMASEVAARRWLKESGEFAWPAAAREDIPVQQRNYHRRFRYAYAMPPNWRLREKDYAPTRVDLERHIDVEERKARLIRRHAVREIKLEVAG